MEKSTSPSPGASGTAPGGAPNMPANPSAGSDADSLKQQAKQQAGELADAAQDKVEHQLNAQKGRAAEALGGVTDALHDVGNALREGDHDAFARYADTTAEQVETFTRMLRDRNVGELLDEAERFARRDAGLFLGGAFLLGVFGARFLKASAPDRFDRTSGSRAYGRDTYGQGMHGQGMSRSGGNGAGGARSYRAPDYSEPPYRVAHTAGGEMPNPSTPASTPAGRTQ